MKKGKSRNKRKKTRSRLLWIAIAVIGIAAVISAVCVAGMLATKENAWKTPEELLVEYMDHIPKQEYEEMYAMFDLFYQENHTANGEFTFGNAMGTSAVYLISKEKFEPVIKSKFKISSEVLQSKTVYYPCEEVYEYKPRGLEETEYPEYPYPEVIGYVNNDDGTLTLKVQAVFPYRGVSKAYIHEVTVRDTKDGGIQYVGNRIIEPINNPEIRWHVPRLTRTEWEELYGDN